jgi:hypothetical protein
MTAPILGKRLDERFLMHRLRSTSLAGVLGGLLAVGLLAWRFSVDGRWSWDLFAVAAAMAVVKLATMAYLRFTD